MQNYQSNHKTLQFSLTLILLYTKTRYLTLIYADKIDILAQKIVQYTVNDDLSLF